MSLVLICCRPYMIKFLGSYFYKILANKSKLILIIFCQITNSIDYLRINIKVIERLIIQVKVKIGISALTFAFNVASFTRNFRSLSYLKGPKSNKAEFLLILTYSIKIFQWRDTHLQKLMLMDFFENKNKKQSKFKKFFQVKS